MQLTQTLKKEIRIEEMKVRLPSKLGEEVLIYEIWTWQVKRRNLWVETWLSACARITVEMYEHVLCEVVF